MDTFTAFLIFAALIALEALASQTWLPLYFRFGIPVSVQRRSLAGSAAEPGALARRLEQRFTGRPQHPSILFRPLPGNDPGAADLAFREQLFENRGGFKYLPVMHSLVRLRPERQSLIVTGYLNWYVLYILGYLVYRSLDDRSFLIVAALILFVLALSYAGQAAVNAQVAEELHALPAARSASAGSQE